MNIKQTYTLHNKFEIEVKDAATGELKQKAYVYNVITDIYFRMRLIGSYGGVNNSINYIGVGTGDGEPSITDTALFTAKAFYSATLVETVYAYPTSYMTRRIKIHSACMTTFPLKSVAEVRLMRTYLFQA